MLYDPKWDIEIKADPFSLDTLIAWLEKQPENKVYCYLDNGGCLLAQYFQANGHPDAEVGGFEVWLTGSPSKRDDEVILPDSFSKIAQEGERTFGAALKRARRLRAHG